MKKPLLILVFLINGIFILGQDPDSYTEIDNYNSYISVVNNPNDLDEEKSQFNTKRNSFSIELWTVIPAISYSRNIPVLKKIGLTIFVGTTFTQGDIQIAGAFIGSTILIGNGRHNFEGGGGKVFWYKPAAFEYSPVTRSPLLRAGYRFNANSGFQVKVFVTYVNTYSGWDLPVPSLALGYSF